MNLSVRVGSRIEKGDLFTVVPKGDVVTRTFPLKIRMKNPGYLKEGMEARVALPIGEEKKAFLVPRDAVLTMFGRSVVFAVIDSKAKMIPVKILGYMGMMSGVNADGLEEGMKVVVKGNERLSDGQSVKLAEDFD
jgi:multidrug efflux pump subunit AcrA (membrane-fusion protein)